MSILALCQWMQNTALAVSIRQSDLMFPLIEGSHILALAFSVGLIAFFDLRLLKLAFVGEPASRVMRLIMPWSLTGFAVMFLTGALLFMTQAEKAYGNTFLRVKFLLLALAGVNALFFQFKVYPNMTEWDSSPQIPIGARACAILSLVFWVGVIVCGRTMAYEI